MKIRTLQNHLLSYDQKKGLFRTHIKSEPHVRELRTFITNFKDKDRDLDGKELVELIRICFRKKTWNGSLSSLMFQAVLDEFGGKDALTKLIQHDCLEEEFLFFLEKNKDKALDIVQIILFLKDNAPSLSITDILNKIDYRHTGKKLWCLELIAKNWVLNENILRTIWISPIPVFFTSVILVLQKQGHNETILSQFVHNIGIIPAFHVLSFLAEVDPSLLNESTVNIIASLSVDANIYLLSVIEILKESRGILTKSNVIQLIELAPVVTETDSLKDLLYILKETEGDVGTNFEMFLKACNEKYNFELSIALSELKEIDFLPTYKGVILNKLIQLSANHGSFINIIKILAKKGLSPAEQLEIVENLEEYIYQLKQLTTLEDGQMAAQIWFFLKIKYPSLCYEKNIELLFEKKLISPQFLDLLVQLNDAKLLNNINFNRFIDNAEFIKSLTAACSLLTCFKKLDDINLDIILDDPKKALEIAKILTDGLLDKSILIDSFPTFDEKGEPILSLLKVKENRSSGSKSQQLFFKTITNSVKIEEHAYAKIAEISDKALSYELIP